MTIRRIGSATDALGRILSLVPGQLIRGRVIKKVRSGRFRITVQGQSLEAASDLPLEAGQTLVARVETKGDRLLLRVQDQGDHSAPDAYRDDANPDDIRRLLQSLGHDPDDLDILEFRERLERYRDQGGLPGAALSDAWVLAILWTRGIRGNAPAFRRLSFYLRQIAREHPTGSVRRLFPDQAASLLCSDPNAENGGELVPEEENQSVGPEPFSGANGNLRQKVIALINRHAEQAGTYCEVAVPDGFHYMLVNGRLTEGNGWARLTDNPVLPGFVVELAKRSERFEARTFLQGDYPQDQPDEERYWAEQWQESFRPYGIEIAHRECRRIADQEDLLALFWRRWHKEYLCDLTA